MDQFLAGMAVMAFCALIVVILIGALRERSVPHDIEWEDGERR